MYSSDEALDNLARSGEAVFAIDQAHKIILWNKRCESLLGQPARKVLGKPCYEVLCGRDGNGNLYCHQACPVAYQARERTEDPVQPFPLSIKAGDGKEKEVSVSLFLVPSYHRALATVVHVVRERIAPSSRVMGAAEEPSAPRDAAPLQPLLTDQGQPISLTAREREILRCLAEGLDTPSIGKRLFIARVTVRNHIQSILGKLDVRSKAAAVAFAYRRRML